MRLAVCNMKMNEIAVYEGKKLVQRNTFTRMLEPVELKAYMHDPAEFIGAVGTVEQEEPEVA